MSFFVDFERRRALLRDPPRRPSSPSIGGDICIRDGVSALITNPLNTCHLIPFEKGWKEFGLDPRGEILNGEANFVLAHRRCNDSVELTDEQIVLRLKYFYHIEQLPDYVSESIKRLWDMKGYFIGHIRKESEEQMVPTEIPEGVMSSVAKSQLFVEKPKTLDTESIAAIGRTISASSVSPAAEKPKKNTTQLEELLRTVTAGKRRGE